MSGTLTNHNACTFVKSDFDSQSIPELSNSPENCSDFKPGLHVDVEFLEGLEVFRRRPISDLAQFGLDLNVYQFIYRLSMALSLTYL